MRATDEFEPLLPQVSPLFSSFLSAFSYLALVFCRDHSCARTLRYALPAQVSDCNGSVVIGTLPENRTLFPIVLPDTQQLLSSLLILSRLT